MASKGDEFLRRKFLHLFKCFQHSRKDFITRRDAEIHVKQLDETLRRQMASQGASNDEIEKRISEFESDWVPSAMQYFEKMAEFTANHEDVSLKDFIAFNMSIREYIIQNDALPLWFEDSLRMSFVKCWSDDQGILLEDGLELLPGVTKDTKGVCHQHLTENNNKKIDETAFLDHIKNFYSNENPEHISKYIHGCQEE